HELRHHRARNSEPDGSRHHFLSHHHDAEASDAGQPARTARLAAATGRRQRETTSPTEATRFVTDDRRRALPSVSALLESAAFARVASGFSNLEFDLERGERGSRYVHCAELLRTLTGAGDALVVNNGAAALVLVLNTLSQGRDAIVSRGELVEIGGSFRIPD